MKEELEKRLNSLNLELKTSVSQKHKMKSKINELEKEVISLKRDNLNSSMSYQNDRSLITRSVSPS